MTTDFLAADYLTKGIFLKVVVCSVKSRAFDAGV